MCGEDGIKRAVYNMKECIEKRDRKFKTKSTQDKTLWNTELNLFQEEIDRYISANPSVNVKYNRFSFGVNLVLWYPRSTNLLFGPLMYKSNTNLGSLQIESLQFLLSN